jgi:hypothetical protein
MNSTSRLYKELFRDPSPADKLNLFQSLFDASEINPDLALALIKIVHAELSKEQVSEQTAYRQYAKTIEMLRYHKADMLQHVVNSWKTGKPVEDPEWLQNGKIK